MRNEPLLEVRHCTPIGQTIGILNLVARRIVNSDAWYRRQGWIGPVVNVVSTLVREPERDQTEGGKQVM